MKTRKIQATLISLFILAFFHICEASDCGMFPDKGFEDPDMSSFKGIYTNPNYLFAVTIPDGLVGHSSPPPNPQHGFGIVLSWNPRAYISFDSSANSIEYKTAEAALKNRIEYVREKDGQILSTKIENDFLGKTAAKKLTIRYSCKSNPNERVDVAIISLRGNNSLVDSADLTTTTDRLEKDLKVFNEITRTWHVTGKY